MKHSINHISAQQVKAAGIRAVPRFAREMLQPGTMTLDRLLGSAYYVRATFGKEKIAVRFTALGAPFRLRGAEACPHGAEVACRCGYWAVRVKSSFGARTLLYYDPETTEVSGLLNIKPGPPPRKPRVEESYTAVVTPEARD